MRFPFSGKVAVITGGAGGIGFALAERFAREGMTIVLSDVEEISLNAAAERLRAGGVEVMTAVTDVAQTDAVERLAQTVADRYGGAQLLCNNAGIVPSGRSRPVWEFAVEDWHWALNVNLMGVVHGIRSFVPRMIASGEPCHVVNTASTAGLISGMRSAVYSTSKHAVVRVSEALYAALQDGDYPIGTTVLCPGLVNTAIYQSERNRPADLVPGEGIATELADLAGRASQGMAPGLVADKVFRAIVDRQFYLVTTDAYDGLIRDRSDALLARRNPTFADVFTVASHVPNP